MQEHMKAHHAFKDVALGKVLVESAGKQDLELSRLIFLTVWSKLEDTFGTTTLL